MIYAADANLIVRVISILTFVFSVFALWSVSPAAAEQLWSVKSLAFTGPSMVIFLLTFRPVFRIVYASTFAKHWFFPRLDGTWEGEIHSNWPRIKGLIEAARGERSSFNALGDPTPSDIDTTPMPVAARIESSLLRLKMEISMSDTRHSYTIFMKPEWRKPARPRVYYLYEQREAGKIEISDRRFHQGAAYLDYNQEGDILRRCGLLGFRRGV
jgi:hypothetical protein